MPEQIEHELIQVRSQLDLLSKENQERQCEIDALKEDLLCSEELKKQYAEKCEQAIELQNLVDHAAIGLFSPSSFS